MVISDGFLRVVGEPPPPPPPPNTRPRAPGPGRYIILVSRRHRTQRTDDADKMGYSVEIVTFLYSASLAMSAFFQNNLLLRKACNSSVPFGECTGGEASAQHVVSAIYSWKACIQYTIPVVLILLAGKSADCYNNNK